MSSERRYNEKEIAAIFKQAASDFEKAQRDAHIGDGLTLKEIESIGKEAGISPEFIARAAAKVDSALVSAPEKKIAGLPIQVSRTIDLPGSFSDSDWDRLVVDLHDTFQVMGHVQNERSNRMRSWKTDSIQVYVEPAGEGYRLRMHSANSVDVIMLLFSSVFLFVSIMFMIATIAKGKFFVQMDDTVISLILTTLGLSVGAAGAFRLPGWYAKESEKIEGIIERVIGTGRSIVERDNENEVAGKLSIEKLVDLDERPQNTYSRRERAR